MRPLELTRSGGQVPQNVERTASDEAAPDRRIRGTSEKPKRTATPDEVEKMFLRLA